MQLFIKRSIEKIKTYLSTNVLFFIFVLGCVFNSWLLRAFTVKNYFELKPLLADLVICLVIGAFGYFIRPKKQFKYFFSWGVFFTCLAILNSVYYSNYISFVSLSLIPTTLQLFSVTDAVVENVIELKDFTFLWLPLFMLVINFMLKKRDYFASVKTGKIQAMNIFVVACVFFCIFCSMLTSLDLGRLYKLWNREFIVTKFGLYTYHINDIVDTLKPTLNPLFGYDEKAKVFREYYSNKTDLVIKNEYSNIFKDKNMIVIHAESIQQFVIDLKFNEVELTPTLNKLAHEGMYFSNFYAQEGVGTSSDTEFTFNTSLLPVSSGTVFVNYWNRDYITIPKLLNEKGYYSFSMHGNNGTYWNRNVVHKEFGYDKFFNGEVDFDLDEKIGLGLSDKSFFRQAVTKIKEISELNSKYYGTLITLTNHTPFSDIIKKGIVDYDVDYKYKAYNEETDEIEIVSAPYLENTKLGNYLKSVHYADEAIGQFINDLDSNNLLDDTIIVIYGDHDAKLKKDEYNHFYNYNPYTDSLLSEDDPDYKEVDFFEMAINKKVPFIIWSKNEKFFLETKKVMGMYDIMPTLGNMFGFYNPYALGNDIFSIDNNVVVFPSGNWVTDKMYYNSQKREGKLFNPNDIVSVEEISNYSKCADEMLKVSNAIIVHDLIKKTNDGYSFRGSER